MQSTAVSEWVKLFNLNVSKDSKIHAGLLEKNHIIVIKIKFQQNILKSFEIEIKKS